MLFAGVQLPGILRVFAVGGRKEAGETLLEALKREGLEEASVQLNPQDSQKTMFFLGETTPQTITLVGEVTPRPAIVWTDLVEFDNRCLDYVCVVWKDTLSGVPTPSAEVDCLLWLDTENVADSRWQQPEIISADAVNPAEVRATGEQTAPPDMLWFLLQLSGKKATAALPQQFPNTVWTLFCNGDWMMQCREFFSTLIRWRNGPRLET